MSDSSFSSFESDSHDRHNENFGKILIGAFIIIIKIIIISCWCCRRNARRNAHNMATPVIITSTSHATAYPGQSSVPQPGYPVGYPNAVPPTAGFAAYPVQSSGPSPYPTQQYIQSSYPTPHTTVPTPNIPPVAAVENMNPPTYDQAVHGQTAVYQKQEPYNPNF